MLQEIHNQKRFPFKVLVDKVLTTYMLYREDYVLKILSSLVYHTSSTFKKSVEHVYKDSLKNLEDLKQNKNLKNTLKIELVHILYSEYFLKFFLNVSSNIYKKYSDYLICISSLIYIKELLHENKN